MHLSEYYPADRQPYRHEDRNDRTADKRCDTKLRTHGASYRNKHRLQAHNGAVEADGPDIVHDFPGSAHVHANNGHEQHQRGVHYEVYEIQHFLRQAFPVYQGSQSYAYERNVQKHLIFAK